jgi:hypothetical protein
MKGMAGWLSGMRENLKKFQDLILHFGDFTMIKIAKDHNKYFKVNLR